MLRRSQISITESNIGKLCLGKQALEIVKSQRKKKKKFKPIFTKDSINLDSRFVDVQYDNNSFDLWFKINSIGNKISLNLPGNKHIHFHKYDSWSIKKSYRLRKCGKKYFIDMIFEKKAPELKLSGKTIGIDQGFRKLIVTSENKKYDTGLRQIYYKISNKKQGSKAFKRVLTERDNKINESINLIPFNEIKTIVVEDLKNVKYKSKFKKEVNNKLQRWSYSKVLKNAVIEM
jgi:IS605 OrfB family transposase